MKANNNTEVAFNLKKLHDAAEPCECLVWCRDGRDHTSPHHPRCEHYTPPPADPRFARFGEAVWRYITRSGEDFCAEEISEDILPLAAAAGLCQRVAYDPDAHGEGIDADPGSEIWWWGLPERSGARLADVAQPGLRERCEATWNTCYPNRRKWAEIEASTQEEWMRVFEIFAATECGRRPPC